MEDGLSIQTKLCLVKNEREERGLKSRVEKIRLAKSLWVSTSDHNRSIFLRKHSRLISRAQLLSGHETSGQNKICELEWDSNRQLRTRRRLKRHFLPVETFKVSVTPQNTPEELEEKHDLQDDNTLKTEEKTVKEIEYSNTGSACNSTCSGTPTFPETQEEGNDAVSISQPKSESQVNTPEIGNPAKSELNTQNCRQDNDEGDTDHNLTGDEGLDSVIKEHRNAERHIEHDEERDPQSDARDSVPQDERDSDNDNPCSSDVRKLHRSPSFITELGLIEEEEGEIPSPEQSNTAPAAPMVLRTNFTPTRRRTQITPTLSPIKDEREEAEGGTEQPEFGTPQSEKTGPENQGDQKRNIDGLKVEIEEDLVDKYIEQVRISNTVSECENKDMHVSRQVSLSNKSAESETEETAKSAQVLASFFEGERKAYTKRLAGPPGSKTAIAKRVPIQRKSSSSKRPVELINKTTGQALALLEKRKGVGALTLVMSTPPKTVVEKELKIQPLCKRYQQAVIPPEFNLDFITRIIRKKAARKKSNQDDDDDDDFSDEDSGEGNFGKKKVVKRRVAISPAKPRVIWTDEKLSSLPDCRYLRLPPLVQFGGMV